VADTVKWSRYSGGAHLPSPLDTALRETTLGEVGRPGRSDAVVVGAGAAGGLAAQALAEAGLNVLVLDAGWPMERHRSSVRRTAMDLVERLSNPRGLNLLPPAVVPSARAAINLVGRWRQPVQSRSYAWHAAPHAFVDDRDCPYVTPEDRPFSWIRARQLGGRMVVPLHGRLYFRLGAKDFAPADGLSPAWPFAAGTLDPWYARVERRLQLAGCRDGLDCVPDSELAHVLELTVGEAALRDRIGERWPNAPLVMGRYSPALRGLDAAAVTRRLLCRQGAVAREIHVDRSGHVSGVTWFDEASRTEQRTDVPLVFLCASALESTRLLMLSRSTASPSGLGAASGVLGRHLMDHVLVTLEGQTGALPGGTGSHEPGRCLFLPRFDARRSLEPSTERGFGVQVYQFPGGWRRSYFVASAFGEMLPHDGNVVSLDRNRRDAWDIPVLRIDCRHTDVELKRAEAQADALRELAEAAGVGFAQLSRVPAWPGTAVHECGTARMGREPAASVLDPNNQCWEARGLYVTDGASFPSQGFQNPTLTILALTERAVAHALSPSD